MPSCPTCSFANHDDALYCAMCGSRLGQLCAACGHAMPRAYRFCTHCGKPLSLIRPPAEGTDEAPQAATSEPTPPPSASPTTAVLEGERRVATIILADVQGSTNLLEHLGSEAWVRMMNRVFQILEGEIYRFGGRVDQFRGDGLVAFFGAPVAHEDDPERAVLAALAMQRAIASYSREVAAQAGADLWLRVGVNTGEVIVASIGDGSRHSEQTAMGEAVALAARMETSAQPGTVLVSENTYRLTRDAFDWVSLGSLQVKGISQPISVYRPVAQHIGPERLADFSLSSSLIGRQRELARLQTCIEDVTSGLGGIAMLVGERGMGKSVLLAEVRRHFARQRALQAEARPSEVISTPSGEPEEPSAASGRPDAPPTFRELRGRARSYEQAQPYTMWQDLLRDWLGTVQDEPREQTAERLRVRATALLGDQTEEYLPDLARLLSLPLHSAVSEQIGHLDANSLRQRLFVAVRSWVEALAQEGPLVITFSDMHWSDATSLELLKYCLPICDYSAVLWLLVYRPDRSAPIWEFRYHVETEYPHRLTNVLLAPLTPEQSEELVDQLVGGSRSLPAPTRELIVTRAEGNPYYIQEFVRALIADGVLEPVTDDDGTTVGWKAKQVATSIAVPDSLQGLLLARIDKLPPDEQRVLQTAAVIGTIFWSNVLAAMASDIRNLPMHITALQRAQLISERGRIPVLGVEYVFGSSLVRDAAYDSLLSTQRALYHLRAAQYLESLSEADAAVVQHARYYTTLAYHYQYAGQLEKELHYTLLSAHQAVEVHAHAEARTYYTRALELLDGLEATAQTASAKSHLQRQRFDVLMGRHRVYYLTGEYKAMHEDVQRLLPLARSLPDDTPLLIDALLHQPGVADYQRRSDIEAASSLATEALQLSRQLNDQRREMESLIAITNQKLALNDPEWHALAEEALALARTLDDPNYEARILVGLGSIYAFSDEPERSQQYLEAAAALAMTRGVEDRVVQLSLLNLLGLEYERAGDYYRLLTEYQEERLRASREIGHRPIESRALQACGRIRGIYLGDYAAALNTLDECRRIDRDTPDEVYPLFHIAHIRIEQGDLDMAAALLAEVQGIGDPVQDRARASLFLTQAMLHNSYGHREANRGHSVEARQRYAMALEAAEQAIRLAQANSLVSRQYEMAAMCKATLSHLGLAGIAGNEEARQESIQWALSASTVANSLYQDFGFAQIVECVSEEILYCHSQSLALSRQSDQAVRFLRRAHDEMMRKHALIPADSPYRRTYLEQIPLHQEIRLMYTTRVGLLLGEAAGTQPSG